MWWSRRGGVGCSDGSEEEAYGVGLERLRRRALLHGPLNRPRKPRPILGQVRTLAFGGRGKPRSPHAGPPLAHALTRTAARGLLTQGRRAPSPPMPSNPRPRARAKAAALALLALFAAGCAAVGLGWEEVDHCGSAGCTPCESDSDCVTAASCCAEAVYCSHRADAPLVCQLGCEEPEPPPCGCDQGRCRFE